MGIPVGWNVVRTEAKEKDLLRADVTGRSPIRRHARGRNASAFDTDALVNGHTSRFAHVLEHASRLSHAPAQLPPAPPVPELREADFDREELRPALTPGFAPAHPRGRGADLAHALPENDPSRARNRDREQVHVDALGTGDLSMLRRFPGGSPPRMSGGRRVELDDFAQGAPPPQPGRVLSWTSGRRHAPYARTARRRDSSPYASDDETPSTTNAVSHPPLRRVGRRSIADGPLPASSLRESWSPVSTIDGLGDRERSNSVSSTSSHLPWQTFLTTVVPDPVAPTAESSFASAAASASFTASSSRASSSNSNSAASERTHLTVPSRRASPASRRREAVPESFARACESSDEGDSTASDTEDEAAANPLSRRRMRPSYFADAPPSPRRYGRSVMDTGSDARRYVRSFYSHDYSLQAPRDTQVDGPVDGPVEGLAQDQREQEADSFATVDDEAPSTSPASPLDQELRDARSLLERLARRADIGDDFWASVGLTRSFTDGIERVQERERF